MKKLKYEQKALIVVSLVAFILCIVVSYFSWRSYKLENELNSSQEALLIKDNELATFKESLLSEMDKSEGLSHALEDAREQYETLNTTLADLKNDEYELVYMGDFKYTYYCSEARRHVCGYGLGITASGKPTEVGWTVAADTSVLPMGSIIYVEGVGFREVQDIGGGVKGQHIDILLNTHNECFKQDLTNGGIWILVKKT